MQRSETTKATLLASARALFWARGFSNVSVRDLARHAGVDVALISRYFGSKRGLFLATLELLPSIKDQALEDEEALIAYVVDMFVTAPRVTDEQSPTALILMNAADPEVGADVQDTFARCWHRPIAEILGSDAASARLSAIVMGVSVAEKTLRLPGLPPPDSPAYRTQLTALLESAVRGA
jgi:AcrR family transcriptional regulator